MHPDRAAIALARPFDTAAPVLARPDLEPEAVALNLAASLRIFDERQLFAWTQGLLQGLLPHEVLICLLRQAEEEGFDTQVYAAVGDGQDDLNALCQREPAFAEQLMAAWQDQRYQVVAHDLDAAALTPETPLQQALLRLGAGRVLGHGTYDSTGRIESFFLFASPAGGVDGEAALQANAPHAGTVRTDLANRVEMLVPFLHAACMRTRIPLHGKRGEPGGVPADKPLLTQREREVLNWMYLGKSNIEIGMLLGISPLTVKNHVQEILRRLDVMNRAQAVGKAFKLRLLTY